MFAVSNYSNMTSILIRWLSNLQCHSLSGQSINAGKSERTCTQCEVLIYIYTCECINKCVPGLQCQCCANRFNRSAANHDMLAEIAEWADPIGAAVQANICLNNHADNVCNNRKLPAILCL